MSEAAAKSIKPLGQRAYGSIPHLLNSRRGPGDIGVNEGMQRICTERCRDKDRIVVQEKLDGSCVSVAKIEGRLVPLIRAGYPAVSSRYEQHRLFDRWVWENAERFDAALCDGERIVGEWLAQAHGTRYRLEGLEPFVVFDIMRGNDREPWHVVMARLCEAFCLPHVVHCGGPIAVDRALELLGEYGRYGAIDPVEGVVYRVERSNKVDFLAKFVRHDKVDGCYLPEVSGREAVWNWRPEQ